MKATILLLALCLANNPAIKPNRNKPEAEQDRNGEANVITIYNEAPKRKPDHDDTKAPEWYTSVQWSNWALVFIAAITAYAVWKQANETTTATQAMRDSIPLQERAANAARDNAETSRAAMIASNRAYVHHDGFRWISHTDPNARLFWRIRPKWINAGNTPTRNLRLYVGYELRDSPLPVDFKFSDGPTAIGTLPPRGSVESRYYDMWGEDLTAIKEGTKWFYAWGVARYSDTFPGTLEHTTKFCSFIAGVSGMPKQPYAQETNPVDIAFAIYDRHNCSDEECDA